MANKHIDKNSLKHLGVCFALTAVLGSHGASAALAASLTKEYCDNTYYGHWCWYDLMFDALGIILGMVVHYFIFKRLW